VREVEDMNSGKSVLDKRPTEQSPGNLAEREGFEPSMGF